MWPRNFFLHFKFHTCSVLTVATGIVFCDNFNLALHDSIYREIRDAETSTFVTSFSICAWFSSVHAAFFLCRQRMSKLFSLFVIYPSPFKWSRRAWIDLNNVSGHPGTQHSPNNGTYRLSFIQCLPSGILPRYCAGQPDPSFFYCVKWLLSILHKLSSTNLFTAKLA